METFLTSVQERAFRMAQIATQSREDALDIVQDTMYDFVRSYSRRENHEWRPLFFRVLQNKIRDWFRRSAIRRRFSGWLPWTFSADNDQQQEDPFSQVRDKSEMGPDHNVHMQDSMGRLNQALENLPLKQQQVFLMRAWEGFSTKETATIMKCSPNTVKTHYSRALHKLQEELKDHWP